MTEKNKLQEWISAQIVADEMLWKGAWGHQVAFARDTITQLVGVGLDWWEHENIPDVISTHRSKSIILPVYEFSRPDIGLRLIARNNFYNWKLSVISGKPIEANFDGLFYTTPPVDPKYTGNELAPCYFEGFPEDLIFGYYAPSNKRKWSAEIGGDYPFYTTIFLIMRSLGCIKPSEWNTEATHRKQLDDKSARHAKYKEENK